MADDTTRVPTTPGAMTTGQSTWLDVPGSLQQLYQQGMGNLNAQLSQQYTPYSGPRVAGLSGLQQSAADMVTRDTPWIENQYGSAANALGTYKPMTAAQVGAPTINTRGADIGRLGQVYDPGISQQQMQLSTDKWPDQMQQYMSPYTQQVTQEIARLGNQNFQENIMPGVNSTFTGQGQFGSTRNAEFANRAMRDAQREIMGQQAKSLESGYGTSANIFGTDQARALQAQQGTASNLLGLGGLGLQANTAANQSYLSGLGLNQVADIRQAELDAQANLSNAGFQQQANQINNQAPLSLASAYQGLGSSGAGALGQLAATQSALGSGQQAQQQKSLDQAYNDWMSQKNWNLQNTGNVLNAVNTVAPMVSGTSTGYGYQSTGTSPTANLVSGLAAGADLYNRATSGSPTTQPTVAQPAGVPPMASANPASSLTDQYNAVHANDGQSRPMQNAAAAGSSFAPTAQQISDWQASQGLGTGVPDLLTGTNAWNRANPNQQITWDQVHSTMSSPANAYAK